MEAPGGEFEVGAGEAFFVPTDAPNKARAVGDSSTKCVAVGAPITADGAVIEDACPNCDEVTRWESTREDGTVLLTCESCDVETARFGAGPDDG